MNIEKRVDSNGDVKYVVHNSYLYTDTNGNGIADDGEMVESKEYDTLDEAINDSAHNNNSKAIMVVGISEPLLGDFPAQGDTMTC